MNTKDKGNIGEAIAIAEFVKRGIQVSIPFGDNARYDLIAEFNGKLNKIQVKYCNQKITENNSISCPCASSTNHTTNKKYTTYENDIDFFVFYLVAWQEIILVPIEKIGEKKSIVFRKDNPISHSSECNFIQDYSFSKYFGDEIVDNSLIPKENLKTNFCINCGKPITNKATRCLSCAAKLQPRKAERPNREELKQLIRTIPFTKLGEQFGVSDNAIKKWCDAENLPRNKKDINNYSDEEWEKI